MKAFCGLLAFASLLALAARAETLTYTADLSGPNESTANHSPATGRATITFDTTSHILTVAVEFQGLTAGTTASVIHCCTTSPFVGTAGAATPTPAFTGFPMGVTRGTYRHQFDLTIASSYNRAFLPSDGGLDLAEHTLMTGIAKGDAYLNIHTTAFPDGEVRGFLVPSPRPGSGPK